MHLDIDRHAYLGSPLHRWDPRCKIASLFLLLVAFAFVENLALLGVICLISCNLVLLSRISPSFMVGVLRYPAGFLLFLAAFLTTTSGGDILCKVWKIPIYRQGLHISCIIFMRSMSQLAVVFVMLETTPFTHTIKALYLLKVPHRLTAIAFFTLRYIYVYLEQVRKMRIAAKLRGETEGLKVRNFATSAGIIGSLMVRSFEQADRIDAAMTVRGYCGKFLVHHTFRCTAGDYVKTGIALSAAILFTGSGTFL